MIFSQNELSGRITLKKLILKLEMLLTEIGFEILKTKSKSNFTYIRKNKEQQILVIHNLSSDKLIAEITLPADIVIKNKGAIKNLRNLINNDNIKVNVSLQNRTMNLRISPYQTIWLEL